MGRLRVWVDDSTEAGLHFIRQATGFSGTRAVSAAVAMLWLVMAEKTEGRRVVSLNPDGTINKEIL
jgi:hypothetical protein